MDWLDLLAVQGPLKSLLQHHSSQSVLWHSAFFMVQFSHPYVTTGKTITSTIQTFVGKITSLLFNTLSRFVGAFLPRSKHLLISWLQSPSAVILQPKKINSVTVSIVPPSRNKTKMDHWPFKRISRLILSKCKSIKYPPDKKELARYSNLCFCFIICPYHLPSQFSLTSLILPFFNPPVILPH